jgi:hypothetical protein
LRLAAVSIIDAALETGFEQSYEIARLFRIAAVRPFS